jgi:ABC-2 type transport system ATP-binding protein
MQVADNVTVALEHAGRRFGHQWAVKDVTLHVPAASIVGLFGPSGCGKTTTIRMIVGQLDPSSGQVAVFGVPPRRFRRWHRQNIGYMPQHFVLYPNLSVWENLSFVASIYGLWWFGRGRRMHEMLKRVDLDRDRDKLVRDVSGGMQRRLELACSMVHNPGLIVMDEPTAGVDPILRERFWEWFRDLADREGRTLFVTSQYVTEAENCDMAAVMKEGELVDFAPPLELRRRAMGGDVIDVVGEQGADPVLEVLGRLPVKPQTCPPNDEHCIVLNARPNPAAEEGGHNPNAVRVRVDDAGTAIPKLAGLFERQGVAVESISEYRPPFDDIFAELIRLRGGEMDGGEQRAPVAQGASPGNRQPGRGGA